MFLLSFCQSSAVWNKIQKRGVGGGDKGWHQVLGEVAGSEVEQRITGGGGRSSTTWCVHFLESSCPVACKSVANLWVRLTALLTSLTSM